MKRYIRSSTQYPERTTTTVNGQRFSIQYAPFARGIYAQISEIHPYDDAEYAWAKVDNSIAYFYKDGKLLDKMHLADYDEDMDGDYEVWWKDMIDSVAEELHNMNKDVKPVMVHY